jgi:hypothetical protein
MGKIVKVTLLAKNDGCDLKDSHVLLGISVGQASHYARSFQATVNSLISSGIQACTFLVADVLQRYNLRNKLQTNNDSDLRQKARALGSQWIQGNSKSLDNLREAGIEVTILRWDECIGSEDYQQLKNEVENLYAANTEEGQKFKAGIDDTVNVFVEKRAKKYKPENFKRELVTISSTEYVKEESAVIASLGRTGKYGFFLYPDEELDAMRVTREFFINPVNPDALRWVKILIETSEQQPISSKSSNDSPSRILNTQISTFTSGNSVAFNTPHHFFNGNGRPSTFMPDDADQELFKTEETILQFSNDLHALRAALRAAQIENDSQRIDRIQEELRNKRTKFAEQVHQLNLEMPFNGSDSDEEKGSNTADKSPTGSPNCNSK